MLGIIRPIGQIVGSMTTLAGGNTAAAIPYVDRSNELGQMAKAIQVFKDNMIETERLRAEQEETKKRAEADRRQAMLDLANRFKSSVGGIVGAVTSASTELQATAEALSSTAENPRARPLPSRRRPSRPPRMSRPSRPRPRSSPPRSARSATR